MALRLILGRAGSGKTALCLREIAGKLKVQPLGSPLILLVPDQASFIMDQELLAQGVEGSFRAQVLSLSRLYQLLKDELSLKELPWLDDLGKSMLISQSIKAHQGDFKTFGSVIKHRGFLDSLLTIIDELAKYQISPQAMVAAAGQTTQPMVSGKLLDLALIYQDVMAAMGQIYLDDTLVLEQLAQAIPQSQWLKNAQVWVDGFSELNPAQTQVIQGLLSHCQKLNFALCLPNSGDKEIFANLVKTQAKLEAMAKGLGQKVEIIDLKTNFRHEKKPILAGVEQAFADKSFKPLSQDSQGPVRATVLANPKVELNFVAQEIWRLTQTENYQLGQIAVITRSLADYQEVIGEVFADYKLPFFADLAKPLKNHPLVEILQSALEVVAEGWSNGAVLRYLKSGLTGLRPEQIDILENYILANGIRGKMWQKAGSWQKYYLADQRLLKGLKPQAVDEAKAERLEEVNVIGLLALKPLITFDQAIAVEGLTVSKAIAALKDLAEDLALESLLADLATQAQEQGLLEQAQGHQQVWGQMLGLLGQLDVFLGYQPTNAGQLAEILQEGSHNLELSTVPPALDEVMVADINRSRLPNIKVAFVVGCNEGIFPSRITEDSIFNSLERQELKNVGLELAASQREQQFGEDYHIYMAMTRASEKLYLTYARQDLSGGDLKPSIIIDNLSQFLPSLTIETGLNQPVINSLAGKNAILDGLGNHLLQVKEGTEDLDTSLWWQVYNYCLAHDLWPQEINAIRQGLAYSKDDSRLTAHSLEDLYGSLATSSVSRLETFNNCPCRYYARYGLGLEPRYEAKLRSLDIGLVYHFILAEVLKALAAEQADWGSLTLDDILPKTKAAMDAFLAEGLMNILDDSGKNRYLKSKILAVVSQNVLDAATQLALGDFMPIGFEVNFGSFAAQKGGLPGYSIILDDPDGSRQIEIRGQIDRVDKAPGDTGDFYRIIDYKMANKDLKVADIYYGLNWQLPVYMSALLKGKGYKAMPAGMFYIPVQDVVNGVADGAAQGLDCIKLQGLAILDFEAVALAERGLVADTGSAKTMNLRIKKDGSFGKTQKGVTPAQYHLVQAYLAKALKNQMGKILAGEICQYPVSKKNQPVCGYCDYQAICAIDKDLDMATRELKDLSNEQIFEAITREVEQNG